MYYQQTSVELGGIDKVVEDVKERNILIQNINQDSKDVLELVKETKGLIDLQNDSIIYIGDNIQNTRDYVVEANIELDITDKYYESNKRRQCFCMCLFIFIVMLVFLILYFLFK